MSDDIVDVAKSVRSTCGGHGKKHKCVPRFVGNLEIESFATLMGEDGHALRQKAKSVGLVVTMSGKRNKTSTSARLYFGLPKSIRHIVNQELAEESLSATKPRPHLFLFNERKDGMFHASKENRSALETYTRYREMFASWQQRQNPDDNVRASRAIKLPKQWSEADEIQMIELRCQTNPATFRRIASVLNMFHERMGTEQDRPFTVVDCKNRWCRMFPSAMDANKTIEYIKRLRKKWPGLAFRTTTENGKDLKRPPTLTGLHVVWPWARKIMEVLSPSIFCDGTHKVTLYHYKVVMITTLDGNKHHRPLMVSFITQSIAEQWCKIFNIFAR